MAGRDERAHVDGNPRGREQLIVSGVQKIGDGMPVNVKQAGQ